VIKNLLLILFPFGGVLKKYVKLRNLLSIRRSVSVALGAENRVLLSVDKKIKILTA